MRQKPLSLLKNVITLAIFGLIFAVLFDFIRQKFTKNNIRYDTFVELDGHHHSLIIQANPAIDKSDCLFFPETLSRLGKKYPFSSTQIAKTLMMPGFVAQCDTPESLMRRKSIMLYSPHDNYIKYPSKIL